MKALGVWSGAGPRPVTHAAGRSWTVLQRQPSPNVLASLS
jgi:hypothetical protein